MTELLEKAIEAVRGLPEDEQNFAAELLLALSAKRDYSFTPDQIEHIRKARLSVAQGKFADDARIERIFGERFE